MVAIVQRYTNALASGLVPLLSRLSAGTEMASYGDAQWEFLLRGNEVTTFVAVDDGNDNDSLLGCLLRLDLQPSSQACASSAGFGMMLVAPEARGKGVAKKLLREAMDGNGGDGGTRKVLAVCTALGQPVYRKIGFAEAGRVTALKTTLARARAMDVTTAEKASEIQIHGSLDRFTDSSSVDFAVDAKIVNALVYLDAQATGWNRQGRIQSLVRPTGSLRSATAIAADPQTKTPLGAAVLRQEGPGSSLVVGPLVGPEHAALNLVAALAQAVPSDVDESTPLSLLVSDHPKLVKMFSSAGFGVGFHLPAMTLDGKPIYRDGDGSYLSLIHPTLG